MKKLLMLTLPLALAACSSTKVAEDATYVDIFEPTHGYSSHASDVYDVTILGSVEGVETSLQSATFEEREAVTKVNHTKRGVDYGASATLYISSISPETLLVNLKYRNVTIVPDGELKTLVFNSNLKFPKPSKGGVECQEISQHEDGRINICIETL
ncbi:hypothetical protein L1D14_25490 [Vibrio tubiashii]|uniref:hypothetical protein n=1 Tax=Vibrio tubiashii TaxID=29498 RepID=UPI001EFEF040|nr:hypothetical protein [Vibrio tubiashii]MCG9579565.1 hypothetical protein [Vibrio tubiashii]